MYNRKNWHIYKAQIRQYTLHIIILLRYSIWYTHNMYNRKIDISIKLCKTAGSLVVDTITRPILIRWAHNCPPLENIPRDRSTSLTYSTTEQFSPVQNPHQYSLTKGIRAPDLGGFWLTPSISFFMPFTLYPVSTASNSSSQKLFYPIGLEMYIYHANVSKLAAFVSPDKQLWWLESIYMYMYVIHSPFLAAYKLRLNFNIQ